MKKLRRLRKGLAFILVVAMVLGLMPGSMRNGTVLTASAETTDTTTGNDGGNTGTTVTKPEGQGTESSPYLIDTADKLYWFAGLVNGDSAVCDYDSTNNPNGTKQNVKACAKLTADIVVNENVLTNEGTLNTNNSENFRIWTPIGKSNSNCQYSGTFDGDNHTISGLYFNDSSASYVGLFGCIYGKTNNNRGYICNVGVVNSYFYGNQYVGGVCGSADASYIGHTRSIIKNCYNTGIVSSSNDGSYVGGVCGYNSGELINCYNTGAVSGKNITGGVCGYNSKYVANCYNAGTVSSSTSSSVGGVCGSNSTTSYNVATITNCYNRKDNSGIKIVGESSGTIYANVLEKTVEEFRNGKVAYLLSQGSAIGQLIYDGSVWKQNLGEENSLPVLCNGARVFMNCNNGTSSYSNTKEMDTHNYDNNGFCPCGAYEPATYNETDNCYEIDKAGKLYWFAGLVNGDPVVCDYDSTNNPNGTKQNVKACAKLTADIVVNENVLTENGDLNTEKSGSFRKWTPIGKGSHSYTGTFNGDNHTISGLYFNDSSASNVGLFGAIKGAGYSTKGSIYNVGVVNSFFSGKENVGGVCGTSIQNSYYPIIRNCYNTGIVSGDICVGGVCGNNYSELINCYNTGTVSGRSYIGGVCGSNRQYVVNCYNAGMISSTNTDTSITVRIGSVCGSNDSSYSGDARTLINCYSIQDDSNIEIVGNNNGTIYDNVLKKDEGEFRSGEVAYLLSQGSVIGSSVYDGSVWGQNLSEANSLPVLCNGARVFKNCKDGKFSYSNTKGDDAHTYDNGFCTVCGAYQPATKNETENCYEIDNAGKLYWFAELVNGDPGVCDYDADSNPEGTKQDTAASAKLMQDITVNSNLLSSLNEDGTVSKNSTVKTWKPIGNSNNPYTGTFDGNQKKVSGLYIKNTDAVYVGLFGNIGSSGMLSNVSIVDSYLCAKNHVGGICGYNYGTINSCHNESKVSGEQNVGGICGRNYGKIDGCNNKGEIRESTESTYYVGGVCGYNYNTIENCYNEGEVSGRSYVGGVCGYTDLSIGSQYTSAIRSCYNTGKVSGEDSIGGVCGRNRGKTVENCYNAGEVSGSSYVGGVCGDNDGKTVENCYNTGKVSGSSYVGGVCANGTATNCYYLANEADNNGGRTQTQFNEGEVAYLLAQVAGDSVWGQELGENNKIYYPKLGGKKVYTNCTKGVVSYWNEARADEHVFGNNGICACGVSDIPVINEEGYYQIKNAGHLYWFAYKVNNDNANYGSAKAILMDNITVNEGVLNNDGTLNTASSESFREWTPIGNNSNSYTGTFDGNEKTVKGLYCSNESIDYVGLFGNIAEGGNVFDAAVEDSYMAGNKYVGGISGMCSGTVTNCRNKGTIKGKEDVGGVCGKNGLRGIINNCSNAGTVNGTTSVGGVSGDNGYYSKINNSHNTGKVSGKASVGGVYGSNSSGGQIITNCYNTAEVSGSSDVGGVCGNNYGATTSYCYNTGKVTKIEATDGNDNIGGVCGNVSDKNGKIVSCYYRAGTSEKGIGNNTGTASVEEKSEEEFSNGYMAYLLQSLQPAVNGTIPEVWGQTIGTDSSPVIGGAKVYKNETYDGCKGTTNSPVYSYSNEDKKPVYNSHNTFDKDGFCTKGCTYGYEPAYFNEAKGYYEISNIGQLYWFADKVNDDNSTYGNANAVLMDNITVNAGESQGYVANCGGKKQTGWRDWTPIGTEDTPYTGTFDGNNKTISGLYSNDTTTIYVGLFGYVGSKGKVTNVNIDDSYFKGKNTSTGAVGGVCGYNAGTIENCYNAGTITNGYDIGGVCGHNAGIITNCHNAGAITAGLNAGGVCGKHQGSKITNCHNEGSVIQDGNWYDNFGGICGYSTSNVEYCYNTGSVTGYYGAGGICGKSDASIDDCYNTGSVTITSDTSGRYVGGVCGKLYFYCYINNCYNIGTVTATVSGNSCNVGGVCGDYFAGGSNNCYYLATTQSDEIATACSNDDFRIGKVANLLQQNRTTIVWGQNIDNGKERENYPVLSDAKVYFASVYSGCENAPGNSTGTVYSNKEAVYAEHVMNKVDAKSPTCTKDGNKEYWTCSYEEGVYYKDKDRTAQYSNYDDTIISVIQHADGDLDGICDVGGEAFKTYEQLRKLIAKVNQNLSNGEYAGVQYTTASIDSLRKALVAANVITAESVDTDVKEAFDNLLAASTVDSSGLIKADKNIVISFADTGAVRGVAAGNGWYANGDSVTLKVTPSVGYTFSRWTTDTAGNTSVGTESTYTFTLGAASPDIYYAWLDEVQYTVTCNIAEGGTCSTDVEGGRYVYGQTAKVTATANENYQFVGWKDSYGTTVCTDTEYSFKVLGNTTLTPEFVKIKTEDGSAITYVTVSFYHQSGKLLDSQKVVSDQGNITNIVNAPTKAGFDFLGWAVKASGATDGDVVDFSSATFSEDTNLYPVFKAKNIMYTLTVNNQSEQKAPHSSVTVTADSIDGQQFVGWKNSDGSIVSYDSTYTFIITGDTSLTSYYEPINAVIEKTPTINMSAPLYENVSGYDGTVYKMTFYFDYTMPEGCTLVDIGTIRLANQDKSTEGITLETENVLQCSVLSKLGVDGQFYYSKLNYKNNGHTVAGYMIYEKNGIRYTVYSNAMYGIRN